MKNVTFAEKNNLIIKHQSGQHFFKDLELFKKHFPAHELNTDLANANQFTYERLDGQMLYALLDTVSIQEILENRTAEPVPVKTIDDIKLLLKKEFNMDEDGIQFLGEGYLQLLTTKTDEEIKTAIESISATVDTRQFQEKTSEEVQEIIKLNFQLSADTQEKIESTYIDYLKTLSDEEIINFVKPFATLPEKQTESEPSITEKTSEPVTPQKNITEEPVVEKTVPDPKEVKPVENKPEKKTVSNPEPEVSSRTDKKKETKAKNSQK